jgi:hypothetical protein
MAKNDTINRALSLTSDKRDAGARSHCHDDYDTFLPQARDAELYSVQGRTKMKAPTLTVAVLLAASAVTLKP